MKPPVSPLFSWMGSKRSLLPTLLSKMPENVNHYFEPFFGGGALFLALNPESAYLSDINPFLMTTYRVIRDHPNELSQLLLEHQEKQSREHFMAVRGRINRQLDSVQLAADFMYLKKSCYGGVFRTNKSGRLGMSYNPDLDHRKKQILDPGALFSASGALESVTLGTHSFEVLSAQPEAFYYLDPPYHQTFDSYHSSRFGEDKHAALAEFCRDIHGAGSRFMLSNSDTPFVRDLYKGFLIEDVWASRSLTPNLKKKDKVRELLIRNYE